MRVGSPQPILASCSPGFSSSVIRALAAAMIFCLAPSSPDSRNCLPLAVMSRIKLVAMVRSSGQSRKRVDGRACVREHSKVLDLADVEVK